MLNHDLARRAKRADLALILQGMPASAEMQPRKPVGKPVARVVTDSLENVHLDQDGDVQAELLKRGWIDDEPIW
ncbi:hypothetical protein D3C81_1984000 [compost metagenome]